MCIYLCVYESRQLGSCEWGLKDCGVDSSKTMYEWICSVYVWWWCCCCHCEQSNHCVSSSWGADQALIGVRQQYLAEMDLKTIVRHTKYSIMLLDNEVQWCVDRHLSVDEWMDSGPLCLLRDWIRTRHSDDYTLGFGQRVRQFRVCECVCANKWVSVSAVRVYVLAWAACGWCHYFAANSSIGMA